MVQMCRSRIEIEFFFPKDFLKFILLTNLLNTFRYFPQNKKLEASSSCDEGDVSEEDEDDSVVWNNVQGGHINENETKNGIMGYSPKLSNKANQKVRNFLSYLMHRNILFIVFP